MHVAARVRRKDGRHRRIGRLAVELAGPPVTLAGDPPFVDLWTVEQHDAFSTTVVGVRADPLDHVRSSSFCAHRSLST